MDFWVEKILRQLSYLCSKSFVIKHSVEYGDLDLCLGRLVGARIPYLRDRSDCPEADFDFIDTCPDFAEMDLVE